MRNERSGNGFHDTSSFDISHRIFGDNEKPPQKEPPEQAPPREDPPPDEPPLREPEQNPKPIKFEL